jgi:spore germination protein GerM
MNKLHDLNLIKTTYSNLGYQEKELNDKRIMFEKFKDSQNFSKIYFKKEDNDKAYLTQSIKVVSDFLVVCKDYEGEKK